MSEWLQMAGERAKTEEAFRKLTGHEGAEVDEDVAVVLLEERVKDKDHEAEWMLGLCFEYGIGTERDKVQAEKLYQRSSEGGNIIGTFLVENGRNTRGSGAMTVNRL